VLIKHLTDENKTNTAQIATAQQQKSKTNLKHLTLTVKYKICQYCTYSKASVGYF